MSACRNSALMVPVASRMRLAIRRCITSCPWSGDLLADPQLTVISVAPRTVDQRIPKKIGCHDP